MQDSHLPDAATLRRLAVKHKIDPRTLVKAIRGEPIKGAWVQEAALTAVAEWRLEQAEKAMPKTRKKTNKVKHKANVRRVSKRLDKEHADAVKKAKRKGTKS